MKEAGLFAFATKECASCQAGQCIGIIFDIDVKGQVHHSLFRNPGLCLLPDNRCKYFEAAVLPLAQTKPEYAVAATDYEFQHRKGTWAKQKDARRCDCGNPLSKRRRFCDFCTVKRRQAAWRKSKGNGGVQVPTVNSKTDCETP